MLCQCSSPFCFLVITLLLQVSSSKLHVVGPHFHSSLSLPPAGRPNEAEYEVQSSTNGTSSRRSIVEGPTNEPFENFPAVVEGPINEPVVENSPSPFVLAAKRTYRRDPLHGFKRYNGGWNIKNRHYWASVGFTAAPVFAIAAIWFLGFGLWLLLILLHTFCCKREPYGHSQVAYTLCLIFLVLFGILAIAGCIVLYTGQGRFHRSTTDTLDYVVSQAGVTVDKLKDVSEYLASAKLVEVDQVFLPSNVQTDIDQIGETINASASFVSNITIENSDDIQDLLDSVRLALIIISAIILLLTLLGFLFSIFGMQLLVYILAILGWLLVTGTFILCGTFLLLHNAAADTCVAMDEWVQNPVSPTSLDEILPCVDNATTQATLTKTKEVSSQLVEVVNQVITNISNINFSPNFKPVYFNQSGPLVPILCNPYYSDLTDRPCSSGEVDLNNATQVWLNYVCQVSADGICITTGRLTPTFYNQMTAAVNVSYVLNNYGPFLIQLEDCTLVRETFAEIYVDHCPDLRRYSKWIYIGLMMVSTAVMLSLIFWIIYGRERWHSRSTKEQLAESTQSLERNKHSQ